MPWRARSPVERSIASQHSQQGGRSFGVVAEHGGPPLTSITPEPRPRNMVAIRGEVLHAKGSNMPVKERVCGRARCKALWASAWSVVSPAAANFGPYPRFAASSRFFMAWFAVPLTMRTATAMNAMSNPICTMATERAGIVTGVMSPKPTVASTVTVK